MYGEVAPEMFSDMLHRFREQHERFLQHFTSEVIEGLKVEIQRLKDENDRLKLEQRLDLNDVGGQTIATRGDADCVVKALGSEPANDGIARLRVEPGGGGIRAEEAPSPRSCVNSTCSWSFTREQQEQAHDQDKVQKMGSMERWQAETIGDLRVAKTRRRLRRLMGLKQNFVSAECLGSFLRARDEPLGFKPSALGLAVANLQDLQDQILTVEPEAADAASNCISLDMLAHLVCFPTMAAFNSGPNAELLGELRAGLNRKTVAEAIDSVTKGADEDESWGQRLESPLWEKALNMMVCWCVIISTCTMGVQVDHDPYHEAWFYLELICTLVFIAEVLIKLWNNGFVAYFAESAWAWNILDVVVTSLSALDVTVSAVVLLAETGEENPVVQSLRGAVLLKTLRIARVLRLVKLLHSPLVRDLANMIVGLVIGLPSLLWVLVLFITIIYIVGFVFRLTLGPAEGQDQMGICGDPDKFNPREHEGEDCIIQYMYGEKYFGTMSVAMFTCFRFMLGDYSTKTGKDLVVILSDGYGNKFNIAFVTWMILIHYGFFNIVSALFVETTITGLKHNDAKRKMMRQYDRNYVKSKLQLLLSRVELLDSDLTSRGTVHRSSKHLDHQIALTEESFIEIMDDDQVKSMLMDLDVAWPNPKTLFDTFDPDGDGLVKGADFVEALAKLRGEPQKHDIITSVLAIRKLSAKIDDLHTVVLKDDRLALEDAVSHNRSSGNSVGRHRSSKRGSDGGGCLSAPARPGDADAN